MGEGESAQGKELMDNTVIVALSSSSGSVLVAITALILNYRGFASIDARMLALESRVDARFNLMRLYEPRPGNLWVFFAQTAAPTCSAAPVTNSFRDITGRRCRPLFPGGFFPARFIVSPLKHSLIYLPYRPRASHGSFCIGAPVK